MLEFLLQLYKIDLNNTLEELMNHKDVKDFLLSDTEAKKEYDALDDKYEEIRKELMDKILVAEDQASSHIELKTHDEVMESLREHIHVKIRG